jgi:hypothetical protein
VVTKVQIDWSVINGIADSLGVSRDARMKWRQRNHVPHKWRRAVVAASGGKLSWADFEKMDEKK